MISLYFNVLIGILIYLPLSAMHVGCTNSNQICTGVIVRNQDNSKRFYMSAQTALQFGNIVQTIKKNVLHKQDRLSLPEHIIDSPYLNYQTLHTLCAYIPNQQGACDLDHTLHDVSVSDVRALAKELGLPYASDVLKDTAYLLHPEAEKPIKFPAIIAKNYQQTFGSYVYKEKFPEPLYALNTYQTIFDCYNNKSLSAKDNLSLQEIDALRNLHDLVLPDEKVPSTLAEFILPSLSTIIQSNQDMSMRIRAIQEYTSAFNCLDKDTKRKHANQADNTEKKEYNLADHLYMLMYDPIISKPFHALLNVSAPYIDEHDISEKRQNILKQNVRKNIDTIIEKLRTGLIQWSKEDPAAALFWEIAKYSDAIKAEIVLDAKGKNFINYKTLVPKAFFKLLNKIKDENTNGFYYIRLSQVTEAKRTHIPLILAMARAFVHIQEPLSFQFYYKNEPSKDTFLRILPEVDIKALDTLYIEQEILLNIDADTIVAPITLCRRPLDIEVNKLPKSWEQYVIHNTGKHYSRVILLPDWRAQTLKKWPLLIGSAFLLYVYGIKPLAKFMHAHLESIDAERQKKIQQQITALVLPELPEPDVAALFFQQAHKIEPFGNTTQQILHDILHKPFNQDTVFSYKTMNQVKHLIDTTRTIEKHSLDAVGQSRGLRRGHVEGGIVGLMLCGSIVVFSKLCAMTKNFFYRSIGIVAELCGGNPAQWVEPLHRIKEL